MGVIYKRFIFEGRHVPNLLYSELRNRIFNKYVKHFSVLNNTSNRIELKDYSSYKKIFAEMHRYGYVKENIENIDQSVQECKNFVQHIKNQFKIGAYLRIGVRFIFLFPTEQKFEDLFNRIIDIFYNRESLNKIGNIYDIGNFAIKIKENNIDININFGPMKKDEIKQFVDFQYDNDPDTVFFLDIDCNQARTDQQNVSEFINSSNKYAFKYMEKFKNIMV